MAWYSVASLGVCVMSGLWQLWYLRRFFQVGAHTCYPLHITQECVHMLRHACMHVTHACVHMLRYACMHVLPASRCYILAPVPAAQEAALSNCRRGGAATLSRHCCQSAWRAGVQTQRVALLAPEPWRGRLTRTHTRGRSGMVWF